MNKQNNVLVNISRHGQCNSWQLRKTVNGKEVSLSFNDRRYGSKANALQCAISARETIYGR
jgi:hypothetical protein